MYVPIQLRLRHQAGNDRSSIWGYKATTAHAESRIIRQMTIARFFNNESKWTFYSVQCLIFSASVFNVLSRKGKKNVIFPPYLHSILNTCNITVNVVFSTCKHYINVWNMAIIWRRWVDTKNKVQKMIWMNDWILFSN